MFSQKVVAQSDDQLKLDNLKYYLSSIKDNIQSMRYYTDSAKVITILDRMDVLTTEADTEINKIELPEPEKMPDPAVEPSASEEAPKIENLDDETWSDSEDKNEEERKEGIGVSKFMPFKKKFNTSFKIEFGINSLYQGTETPAGILTPEINTGGSWYWNFSLNRRARLGGKNGKVAFNYGIGYLKNRFKIENDLRLTTNPDTKEPSFVVVDNANENPKLNIGYINVPLSFSFALSKKTKLELGGYAGYRINTVQKFHIKTERETIHEHRFARHQLNNWVYGATAALDISGFDIIARYNISKLFKDNPNYDYNTFMIGTSISLF